MKTSFPAIASILSPEALMQEVLPGFGVGPIADCQFYSGGFNHTYRVQTCDGSKFYLRAYRIHWRTLEDIQVELEALLHLKLKGYPAISPLPYKDGQYFCSVPAPEGSRCLALFTEAPGEEVSYAGEPATTARRYGQAVAHMHNALDDFKSTHQRFHLDFAHFIDQPLHYIQPFLSYRAQDWNYLQQFAEILRQRLLGVPADLLEQGFCHGDLQGYHAKTSASGKLTFFDFDCSGFGYRAYDLAVFLWCCRLEDATSVRWEPFLKSYLEVRPVPERDLKAIPLFVCARYLWHMGVHTQNSPDWGIDFLNNEYFDRHLAHLRQAEEDYFK